MAWGRVPRAPRRTWVRSVGSASGRRSVVATEYRFSFGPWNLHEGADPFGPAVRRPRELAEKLDIAVRLGFQGIQLHDDDVVPSDASGAETERGVAEVRRMLDDRGLVAE